MIQRFGYGVRLLQSSNHFVDARMRCACFGHRPFVKFEMTNMSACWILIAFFAQDDLVDEEAQFGRAFGNPWRLGASEMVLEVFEERHEVPNRIDMVFHE